MTEKGRVLVAMSGGVDSSLAAALLLREGWRVEGAVLDFSREPEGEGGCAGGDTVAAAAAAAAGLGIPLHRIEAGEAFEREVLRPAWEVYTAGRTPSPCLRCNDRLKFGLLFDFARELGVERVASGHYARILPGPRLLRGRHREKDQSYFLARVGRERLARILTPLGGLTKAKTRGLAAELGLPAADRRESQDACLAPVGGSFAEALRLRLGEKAREGNFVDTAGRVLGPHRGLHRYTPGQRRGLGIALGRPAFVAGLRPERGEVVLTTEEKDLRAPGLIAADLHWLAEEEEKGPFTARVQLRSRPTPAPARVTPLPGGEARIEFATPQRAVAPGQAAVIYAGDEVLAAGWIDRPLTGQGGGISGVSR